ncbi:spore germination protein [Filobacillus milosensis]|uniref:Spore germination protein n=1 Tax=Filobacillus milosensis TaxID=94137 RepID=A0A4Y8ILN0_9BACI|nr:spore germination protein [Filobacillus milosensis]TFB22153.1 spore germination protein [Filobacillus milosensis]
MSYYRSRSKRSKRTKEKSHPSIEQTTKVEKVSMALDKNLSAIKTNLGDSNDVVVRRFNINKDTKAALVYIDGLADRISLQDFILKVSMSNSNRTDQDIENNSVSKKSINYLKEQATSIGEVKDVTNFKDTLGAILSGDTAVLIESYDSAIIASTRGWEKRDVSEPTTQNVIRGPKEAFTENLRTNTSLIRRKIKDPDIRIESKTIGKHTNTDIAIVYIDSISNKKVLDEVRKRIDQIDIDGILESAYIEEMIEDSNSSPFPTIINSERPDVVSAALLEGRVAIIIDGTPFVLIVPALFIHFFQSPEDYYERSFYGIIRVLRYLAFFSALLVPSLYIAVTTFHQEMIPTTLLIDLAAQREGIPFPAYVEALIMEVTFEILREAGIRMPRAIGQAVSIVGALVLGQAAVEAGLVSPTMVIVVSITAISSFVFPAYDMAISVRILRFGFMTLAATFGLFGISIGLFLMLLHLCSLRSFGIPYMSPFGPVNFTDQKDAVFRFPRKLLSTRPRLINQTNTKRQNNYRKKYGRENS